MQPFEYKLERSAVSTFFDNYDWEVFAVEALNKLEFQIEEEIWDWISDGFLGDENASKYSELWNLRPFKNLVNSSDFDKEQIWWNWRPDDSGLITEEAWGIISKTIDIFLTRWFQDGGVGTYQDNIDNIEELKEEYGPATISLNW